MLSGLKGDFLATAAFVVILLFGVNMASGLLVPFFLAVFVAIIGNPLAEQLERLKFPKVLAVLTTLCLILCIGTVAGQLVGASIHGISQNLPEYKQKLILHVQDINWLNNLTIFNFSIKQTISSVEPGTTMSVIVNLLKSLSDVLGNVFLILLASTFMMLEADEFKRKFKSISLGSEEYNKKVSSFIVSVKGYMFIKTMISLLTGLLVGFSLFLLNVDHYVLWGLLAFLLNFIPTIGSIFAAIPPVCLAFIQYGSGTALVVIIIFFAINMIIGNIIEPKFMGNGLGLSTLVVLLSMLIWGALLGPIGMILSIPLTMVIKIGCDKNEQWHWLSVILSDKAK